MRCCFNFNLFIVLYTAALSTVEEEMFAQKVRSMQSSAYYISLLALLND